MNLVKCPRCDLNYIREDEKYCKVCLRELKGENSQDEVELCSICNEEPALPGRDICPRCLSVCDICAIRWSICSSGASSRIHRQWP